MKPNPGWFTTERLTRHGMHGTPTWAAWKDMKARCSNPNLKNYHRYGGRGITFCERWKSFDAFLEDMGNRPDGMTIERKNNDGPYSPDNCKWASRDEQANNTRRNRFVCAMGRTQTISQWAKEFGVSRFLIRDRLDKGIPADLVISEVANA